MNGTNFKDVSDNWAQRLDWRILQNGPIALYFNPKILDDDITWFENQQYVICSFDCSTWKTVDDFHRDVADILKFPEYYGKNLDAFNDCLGDIHLLDNGGCILKFLHFDYFLTRFPEVAWNILDIVADNSRRFLFQGKRLIGLVQSDDPRIELKPVGATPVIWNPQEWLSANRGLS